MSVPLRSSDTLFCKPSKASRFLSILKTLSQVQDGYCAKVLISRTGHRVGRLPKFVKPHVSSAVMNAIVGLYILDGMSDNID